MKKIRLRPLEGITVGEKEISFGQTRHDIIDMIGSPDHVEKNQLFYDNLGMRFDLDENGLLEFIECQGPYPENSEVNIYCINPFRLRDNELVDLLTAKNNGEIDGFEAPYCYSFSEISVGIWRASVPADIEAAIAEMRAEGTYEESRQIMDLDLEKSKYFWTVAIGKVDYYKI